MKDREGSSDLPEDCSAPHGRHADGTDGGKDLPVRAESHSIQVPVTCGDWRTELLMGSHVPQACSSAWACGDKDPPGRAECQPGYRAAGGQDSPLRLRENIKHACLGL